MSSNGRGPGGGSTTSILVDVSDRRSRPAGNGGQPAVGLHDGLEADLSHVTASLTRVEQEFDELWHAAVVAGERAFAEQLVDVSHALRRAARLLENNPGIG
jgi:hypothetical protein